MKVVRCRIENLFGCLKKRFRRLTALEHDKFEFAEQVIHCICRLWNLSKGDAYCRGMPEYDPSHHYLDLSYDPPASRSKAALKLWRDEIAADLPHMKSLARRG